MDFLSNFSENLSELLDEKNLSVEEFASSIGIVYSEIYRYLRKEYLPKLSNMIKIADTYGCSIDYLLGRVAIPPNTLYKKTPPFHAQFQKLLQETGTTRYSLGKQTNISISRLDDWYHGKYIPSLDNALALAKFFNCSLDYLLGRE